MPFSEKLWKNEKTQRQTCHSKKNKKLFGVRTKLSYHKFLHRKYFSNKTEKSTEVLRNKPVCVGLSILELSKIM